MTQPRPDRENVFITQLRVGDVITAYVAFSDDELGDASATGKKGRNMLHPVVVVCIHGATVIGAYLTSFKGKTSLTSTNLPGSSYDYFIPVAPARKESRNQVIYYDVTPDRPRCGWVGVRTAQIYTDTQYTRLIPQRFSPETCWQILMRLRENRAIQCASGSSRSRLCHMPGMRM
ncbi:hypothetical protein BD410DRAFT_495932 [Rickenella mellea]|uniref:Uncharacterized protein n=1 Tax=Rickenella mellea TaxID=50990 RepID=A0A4Y7PST8_9AGAM|nr:hypothetical protein BD410DRAFT_495932 [Rickenella mellea]